MIHDRVEVGFGNFGKHLADCATRGLLGFLLSGRPTVELLPRRVVFYALCDPIRPLAGLVLVKTMYFVVDVAKLAARQSHDLHGKVMSDAMDVVRQLLGVGVHLVLGFCLVVSVSWESHCGGCIARTETMCTSRLRWRHCSLHHSVNSGFPAGTKPNPSGALEA